ncbi:2-amino-4-hydroxy-6-hydroxymethyldihydropteridine diphosphokinase [Bacillus salitolerans]|uniref:2-amino-4-hydroxy-6-hydroxymethyldihydropteridine diphosphokinase n=1 Tax=Bacillus salitolerans TaxID=1437434 RepID=A0ABW4LQG3_9BACI
MNLVYIGLGTNMGARSHHLKLAIEQMLLHRKIKLVDYSSIYETEPVGYVDQDSFLNMVISISTNLTAEEILHIIQEIELLLGRKREIKWGPRTLDLDILLFNQQNIMTEDLIVPHPRMHERSFVLIPLYEIDPNLEWDGYSIKDRLLDRKDREGVQIWKQKNGEDVFELFEN